MKINTQLEYSVGSGPRTDIFHLIVISLNHDTGGFVTEQNFHLIMIHVVPKRYGNRRRRPIFDNLNFWLSQPIIKKNFLGGQFSFNHDFT